MTGKQSWVNARDLWAAVERIEGSALGLGARLRPYLARAKLRLRADLIVSNETGIDAKDGKGIPAAVLAMIQDDSLLVGSDTLVIIRGSWAGPAVVFEAVGLTFNRADLVTALRLNEAEARVFAPNEREEGERFKSEAAQPRAKKNPGPDPECDWNALAEAIAPGLIDLGMMRPLVRGDRKKIAAELRVELAKQSSKDLDDSTFIKRSRLVDPLLPDRSA